MYDVSLRLRGTLGLTSNIEGVTTLGVVTSSAL